MKLLVGGVPEYTVAEGDGPVNALDAALRKALKPFYAWTDAVRLIDYKVRIVDGSRHGGAHARVNRLDQWSRYWGTVGVSDNIIEASWRALVDSFELYGLRIPE